MAKRWFLLHFTLTCWHLVIVYQLTDGHSSDVNGSTVSMEDEIRRAPVTVVNRSCPPMRSQFFNAMSDDLLQQLGANALSKQTTPVQLFVNHHLKVCAKGFTCCTEEMENQFILLAQHDFRRLVQDSIMNLVSAFKSRTHGFDRFFRELLAKSQHDLHSMFMKTYGILYEQNSDLFVALFDNLTSYYTYRRKADGTVLANGDLDFVMDRFYENLYRRMFRMLNQPYQLDEDYWQCMSKHMHQLQPFGQVPEKMKLQVLKAFSAARTFIHALTVGGDVISKMLEMKPSAECMSQLTRMLHCQHCQGVVGVKPCISYCLAVTSRCLLSYMVFDRHWNEYLDSLLQLLDRLEGPYNIESVINPIDIQISEAIMIFQDKGKEISDKVFAGCGRPRLTTSSSIAAGQHTTRRHRLRRAAKMNDLRDLRFGPVFTRSNGVLGTSMDLLAKEMKEKTMPTRGFWRYMPERLCSEFGTASNRTDTECWNGTQLVSVAEDEEVDPLQDSFNQESLKRAELEPIMREIVLRIKRTVSELRKVMAFESSRERHRPVPPQSSVWKPAAKVGLAVESTPASTAAANEPIIEHSGYGSSDPYAGSGHSLPFDHVQTDDEDLLKEMGRKNVYQGSGSGMPPMVTDGSEAAAPTDHFYLPELTTIGPIWVDERHHPGPDFEVQMATTPFLLRPYTRPADYDVYEEGRTVRPKSSSMSARGQLFSVLLCSLMVLMLCSFYVNGC